MEQISSSDLKTILHSKRANTTTLLLGPGTSATQAAMHGLGKAGVMVGFYGGGQSLSDGRTAIHHADRTRDRELAGVGLAAPDLGESLDAAEQRMLAAKDVTTRLTEEARLTKALYRLAAEATSHGEFTRAACGGGTDTTNRFLNHGSYLAYGLGATAAWVLTALNSAGESAQEKKLARIVDEDEPAAAHAGPAERFHWGRGMKPWGVAGIMELLYTIAETTDQDLERCARKFATLRLPDSDIEGWTFHPLLGFDRKD